MKKEDFIKPSEYDVLVQARDTNGQPYKIVHLPLTQKNVGGDKGYYVNYYVGNEVVIVPIFNDPSDAKAINILKGVYPNRRIEGVNMEELWKDGGGAHCVTQQQPVGARR